MSGTKTCWIILNLNSTLHYCHLIFLLSITSHYLLRTLYFKMQDNSNNNLIIIWSLPANKHLENCMANFSKWQTLTWKWGGRQPFAHHQVSTHQTIVDRPHLPRTQLWCWWQWPQSHQGSSSPSKRQSAAESMCNANETVAPCRPWHLQKKSNAAPTGYSSLPCSSQLPNEDHWQPVLLFAS